MSGSGLKKFGEFLLESPGFDSLYPLNELSRFTEQNEIFQVWVLSIFKRYLFEGVDFLSELVPL